MATIITRDLSKRYRSTLVESKRGIQAQIKL